MTTLWRINISPDVEQGLDARKFCFDRGIVGCGWSVNHDEGDIGWETYERLATEIYYQGERNHGWWPALNALHNRMQVDDLIWSRDHHGMYFLGRVIGPWNYTTDSEHWRHDIVNYRKCEWHNIGGADSVPGTVRNSFSRGRVLQVVRDETALTYSKETFNRCVECTYYEKARLGDNVDLFSLLSPEGVEDLVAVYLQAKGYSIIPSSCHRTTANYEFILRSRESGILAFVQVKSGSSESLNRDVYSDLPGNVYLFATSQQYVGNHYPNVRCIARHELEQFAYDNYSQMPPLVARWMDVLADST